MARKSKPWFWSERGRWATTVDGKRTLAPPDVETEHDAWAWHAELVAGLAATQPSSRAKLTVDDVLEAYAAWDAEGVEAGTRLAAVAANNLSAIQVIVNTKVGPAQFGSMLVSKVTVSHYDALTAAWRRAGRKPSYVASVAQKLKTAFLWATRPTVDRGPMIDATPFKGCKTPPVPASRERYGDRATAASWLRFLWRYDKQDLRNDAMLQRCLIHTGARPSELVWATWGDVRWDAMTDSVGNPMAVVSRSKWKNAKKTGKVRRVFLPSRLVRAMRRRSEGKGAGDLIFPTPTGARYTSPGISGRTGILRKLAAEQGLAFVERDGKAITNYLWRHIAASDLISSGVPIATAAELLGTSVAQIARTYAHLLTEHLGQAAEALGNRSRAKQPLDGSGHG